MGNTTRTTPAQREWLKKVLGPEIWRELCKQSEFLQALETSMSHARRVALHHLAAKERFRRVHGSD